MPEPRTNRTDLAPYAALLAVQFLFGSMPVVGKFVLAAIPSVALVGFRVGITAAVLYVARRSGGSLRLDDRRDYWRLALLSFFGVTFNQLLFIGGLSVTKASNTSLLAVTIPIFALAIGAIVGTERLVARKVVGIALAAVGVVFLIDPRNASFSSVTTLGDILIVLNSLSFGIYVATSKPIFTRNGPLRSIAWIFIFAAVVCVPLGLYSLAAIDLTAIEPLVWVAVLHIAVGATSVPYLLNAWALVRVSPSTLTVFIYLQPVIGFLAAVVFLGERLDAKFAVATILIFIGLFLTVFSPRRAGRET